MQTDRNLEDSMRLYSDAMHAGAGLGIETATTRANQMDTYSRKECELHQSQLRLLRSAP